MVSGITVSWEPVGDQESGQRPTDNNSAFFALAADSPIFFASFSLKPFFRADLQAFDLAFATALTTLPLADAAYLASYLALAALPCLDEVRLALAALPLADAAYL